MSETGTVNTLMERRETFRQEMRIERLVTDISSSFINIPQGTIDRVILNELRRLVEGLGIDCSLLTQYSEETREFKITHYWVVDNLQLTAKLLENASWPWIVTRMQQDEIVAFPHIDDLPPEAAIDKTWFQAIELKSQVSIPLKIDGQLVGLLSLGTLRVERDWPVELLERVQTIGSIFANVLARKRSEAKLACLLGFERLLAEMSASFVNLPPQLVDQEIEQALCRIGKFLAVDRVVLWEVSSSLDCFRSTYTWMTAKVGPPPFALYQTELPLVFKKLIGNECAYFLRLDDLTVEAFTGHQKLAELTEPAIKSHLFIPLSGGGTIVGALSLSTVSAKHQWSATFIPRIRLLGEIFNNTLLRRQTDRLVREAKTETAQYRERLAHLVRVHTVGEMSCYCP